MQNTMVKRAAAGTLLGGSLLFTGLGVANAAPPVNGGGGLVNVQVGNVTVAKSVTVDAAVPVAANVCGVNVQNINVLASQVAQTGQPATVCTAPSGPVTITSSQ